MKGRSLLVRSLLGGCVAFALGGAWACSHRPPAEAPSSKETGTSAAEPAKDPSTATPWRYHPTQKAQTTASLPWKEGAILEVDGAGSRWLRRPGQPAEVAAYGAPEPLVGFVKDGARWGAVGRRGTVYFFSEALGPWEELRSPPEALVKSVVQDGAIYGVSSTGRGVVSEDAGRSYAGLEHEGLLVDVAAADEFGVVFVAAPERWLSVARGSRRARALELPTIAPLRLEQSREGALVATSLYGPRVLTEAGWMPSPPLPASEPESAAGDEAAESEYTLPEHARAAQLRLGHAVMSEGSYFAVESDEEGVFTVKQGDVDSPLSSSKMTVPKGCRNWRVVGSAQRPFLFCAAKEASHTTLLSASEWDAEAARFVKLALSLRGDLSELRGELSSASGELVLGGLCPPHASEKGCAAEGLVGISLAKPTADEDAEQARHLPLQDKARLLSFVFSPNGTLHVLSLRTTDEHLVLESFRPGVSLPRSVDLTRVHPDLRVDEEGQALLGVGRGGAISVVTRNQVGMAFATLDAEQRFLVTRKAPSGVDLLSGHGQHVAGVDLSAGVFWTSTDYGASFVQEALPQPLCREGECRAELACDPWGCLVGEELLRVGYEASGPGRPLEPPVALRKEGARPALPSLECRADEAAWQVLEGLTRIPQASDAWLGATLWTSATYDPNTASVVAVFARAGADAVERHALLGPVPDPEHYALSLSPQVEGTVALRARLSAGQRNAAGAIEVGWDNRVEDLIARTTLDPVLGEVPTVTTTGRSRLAQPALLSIGGRGLHLQLESRGPTHLLRSEASPRKFSVETVFETSWPRIDPERDPRLDELLSDAREERIVVDGQPGALLLLSDNRIVVRAHRQEDGGLAHTPILLGSLARAEEDPRSGVRLAYLGKQIGFVTFSSDADAVRLGAEFVALSADGGFASPVRVPVMDDLAARPEACAAATRSSTPRIVAPELGSTTREVWISGLGGEAIRLTTDSAVLFGSMESPCLAVLEAAAPADEQTTLHALVTPESSTPSWLFSSERSLTGARSFRAQPMSCAWSAKER